MLLLVSIMLIFTSAPTSFRCSSIIPKCIYLSKRLLDNFCFTFVGTSSKHTMFPIELVVCWLENLTIFISYEMAYVLYCSLKFFFYILLYIIIVIYLHYFHVLKIFLDSNGLILGLRFTFVLSPKLRLSNFFSREFSLCSLILLDFLVHPRRSSNLLYSFSMISFITCYSMCTASSSLMNFSSLSNCSFI